MPNAGPDALGDRIAGAIGRRPVALRSLGGGCVADVRLATFDDGACAVVKVDGRAKPSLDLEGWMLRFLSDRSNLPVPEVLHAEPGLLVLERLPGSAGVSGPGAETHAAELLAALHGHDADCCGLSRDTLIGALPQPNPYTPSWIEFFREHRLLHMAHAAHEEGRLPSGTLSMVRSLADRLGTLLEEPEAPALLHGDVWSGNVLCERGRVTGFIDPAIYYGHPEIELAFITLFSTCGEPFFARYRQLRPIRPGFFEVRRDIYNLYPLLVHTRLFDPPGGGSYATQVGESLRRIGR